MLVLLNLVTPASRQQRAAPRNRKSPADRRRGSSGSWSRLVW